MNRTFVIACCISLLITTLCAGTDLVHRIAFERDHSIWIANLDGTDAKKIASGDLPEISPDGTKVAFNTDEPTKSTPIRHIAIVDIGSGKVNIFRTQSSDNSFGPVWSPDNKSILFSTYMDKSWQLGFVNADGTGFRVIKKAENETNSYSAPAWAADGKSFFCHDLDAIYQFDLSGAPIKKWEIHSIIANGDMNSNSRMSASPDGKSLIMDIDMAEDHNRENWDGPPPSLWLLALSADKATRLTEKDYFAWDPFWIDGQTFLFLSQGEKENQPSIYKGSTNQKGFSLILKNARTPSASR